MTILILTTHMNIGGIATYVVHLARGLAGHGHKVSVASSGGTLRPKLPRHIEVDIMTKSEFSPKVLKARRTLRGLLGKEKIDILHAQTRVAQVLADALSQDTGIPYVTTCHGFFQPRLSRRLFPCWGRRVIAISDAVKKHLIEAHRVKEDKINLIYNGVEVAPSQPALAERPEVSPGLRPGGSEAVIGMIGRLVRIKGHEILLKAMPQIIKAHPSAKALIVGEGEMRLELERLAERLGLRDRVTFMDNVSDTKEVLARMGLFVAPNTGLEGLGLSILEAMVAGLPVVASRIGGIETIIQDGVNGILVPPGDVGALVKAILRVLKDARLAGRLGEEARRTASERFSVDRMVDETLKVYREVRGGKGKRGQSHFLSHAFEKMTLTPFPAGCKL